MLPLFHSPLNLLLVTVVGTCFLLQSASFRTNHLTRQLSTGIQYAQFQSILHASSAEQVVDSLEIKSFLLKVLSARTNLTEKQSLVKQLQGLRANENDGTIDRSEDRSKPAIWNGSKSQFLDAIISELQGPATKRFGSWLSKIRWPFALPSYRVKLATLQRLMEIILEEEAETIAAARKSMATAEWEDYYKIRQRRALSIVLGQLQNQENGARGLEVEACRRKKNAGTMEEMLERTPKGLETPPYHVVDKTPATWEVRKYDSFSVCSLLMNAAGDSAVNVSSQVQGQGAFNSLAGYIFGKNQESTKMAMTTPVISIPASCESPDVRMSKKMMFVMPSNHWADVAAAPAPLEGSNVVVEAANEFKSDLMAVMWFGGVCTSMEVQSRSKSLKDMLDRHPKWRVKDVSEGPLVLQYNDPFQPPWRRRNEICFPVVSRE